MNRLDLKKLLSLLNNVAPLDLVVQVYGAYADAGYLEEKARMLSFDGGDFVRWASSLDDYHLERLAELVNERRGVM